MKEWMMGNLQGSDIVAIVLIFAVCLLAAMNVVDPLDTVLGGIVGYLSRTRKEDES